MAYNAGTAWLQVVPSFLHMDRALAADVKRLAKTIDDGLSKAIPDAMRRGVDSNSRSLQRSGEKVAEHYSGSFASMLQRRIGGAIRSLPDVEIGVARNAFEQDMKEIGAELRSIRDQHIRLEIDDDEAIKRVEKVRKRMLEAERGTNDRASVVNLRSGGAELDAFGDIVREARRSGAEAGGNFGGAFGREANRHFDKLLNDIPDIPLRPDLTIFDHAMRSIRKDLTQLRDFRIGIDGDADEFFRRVAVVEAKMRQLRAAGVSVPFNVDMDRGLAGLRQFVDKVAPQAGEQAGERLAGSFTDTVTQRLNNALRALPEVDLSLNPSPALREINRIRQEIASIRDLHINGELDASQVLARLAVLQARLTQMSRQDVDIQVRADTAAATVQLAAVAAIARDADNQVRGIGDAAAASMGRLGALIAIGLSLGTTLVPAAAAAAVAIGSIATAALAAGAGLGVLILGFSGVVGGVTALNKYQQDANKSAKSLSQSQNQILNSANALTSAEESLANARRQGAEGARQASQRITDAIEAEKEARKDAARAVQQALRAQVEAEKDLTFAQHDAKEAREDLTKAYEQAVRRLADLRRSVRDNALDQRQAVLDLAEAKQELAQITANPRATQAEIEQARISYERRANQIDDLKERSKELAADQAKADREGLDNAEEVRQARERVARADERVADAQQKIADAQQKVLDAVVDGNKRVAAAERNTDDARRAAAEQQIQSSQQVASAARAVEQAQRGVTQAYINSGVAGGEALDNLNDAMKQLSPEAQRFVRYLYSMKDAALSLRMAAERGMLPGFQSALRELMPYLPTLEKFIFKVGDGLGWIAQQAVKSLKHPVWREFFGFIDDTAVPALKGMWTFAEAVGRGLASLIMRLSAFNGPIGRGLIDMAEGFATWSDSLSRSRGFSDFLSYVERTGPKVVDLLGELATFMFRFIVAAAPIGEKVVDVFDALFSVLNKIPVPILTGFVVVIGALSIALLINTAVMRSHAAMTSLMTNLGLLWGRVQAGLTVTTNAYTGAVTAAALSTGVFSRALVGATAAATATQAKMSTLAATAGGPLATALAVAAAGAIWLWQHFDQNEKDAERASEGIASMADEYRKTGKVSREFVRDLAAVNPEAARQIATFEDLGVSAEEMARAMNGSAEDMAKVNEAIDARIAKLKAEQTDMSNFFDIFDNQDRQDEMDRLTKLKESWAAAAEARKKYADTSQAERDAERLNKAVTATGDALASAGTDAQVLKKGIEAVGEVSGDASVKAGLLATMSDRVADSTLNAAEKADLFDDILKNIGAAADTHGATFDALAVTFTNIAESSLNARDKVDLLKKAMDLMYGAVRDQNEANESLVEAQSRMTTQLATNSAGFNLETAASGTNTEAILANRRALEASLKQAELVYEQDIANGMVQDEAKRKHDATVQSILSGIEPTQRQSKGVQELVGWYGHVPDRKETTVSTPGLDKALEELITAHAIQVGLAQTPPWSRALIENEIDYLRKTVIGGLSGGALRSAEGGPVPGYSPSKTADNIPAWLTAREFVQPVDTVDFYGVDVMEAMRQRRIPREMFTQGYAAGGSVNRYGNNDLTRWPINIANSVKMPVTVADLWKQWSQKTAAWTAGVANPASINAPRGTSYPALIALEKLSGIPFTVSSTYRPGANDWHGQGMAVDSYASAGDMVRMASFLMKASGNLLELIHSGGEGFFVKNGKRVGAGYYGADIVAQHYNHVHVAATQAGVDAARAVLTGGGGVKFYDSGGYLPPGYSTIFNGTGKPEPVLNPSQWQAIQSGGAGQGSGMTTNNYWEFRDTTLDESKLRAIDNRQAALARVGRAR